MLRAVKEVCFRAPFELIDLTKVGEQKRCLHAFTKDSDASSRNSRGFEEEDSCRLQESSHTVVMVQRNAMDMESLVDHESRDYGLVNLATKILPLLSALPDNQFTSFR